MWRNLFWLIVFVFLGIGIMIKRDSGSDLKQELKPTITKSLEITVKKDEEILIEPVVGFKKRITKKFFGTIITPVNSPVNPERFSGYHTGVDVEFDDVEDEVVVEAIFDGEIIYLGNVNGYGGVVAEKIFYKNQYFVVIYGHLDPDSLMKNNMYVKKGDKIGILGEGYSQETDGERKHLHLGIVRGEKVNLRGYVQNKDELSGWMDPLELF
ncbi:TPA: hypothetical protein DIC29_01735 [Candidatus Shapirobacteria bacterium]|uniref:M23ase beta-sheet core domain-containing protein n=3 Tax=Patescibacteria group TaxID=1783273 RepID=A0A0G0JPT2_9BACT|nr:MAG: hypothetical protein US90_C0021G0005 [Candidatus Shapirobacteria bacterium GW2011_GWE2_38_30]OGJ05843.1 MAG: hypothetical protein A2192_01260 [Candidatus Nomurabacteria bacterium RIFOXYA1_FULL_35_17]OGL56264.1 MAG: hypothetical protein A2367_03290 [Candidatus Shapirobacteria bacterium RIFOXYB1_FULL_38_38]HAP38082.1 hypothetical protein [Candidatus Shapirobacteria bacterium]HCU55164.1 hypothetical protein [Candidatus Shapirobacteria bacterium]